MRGITLHNQSKPSSSVDLPPLTEAELRYIADGEEALAAAAARRGDEAATTSHAANADLVLSLLDVERRQRAREAAERVGSATWVRNILVGPLGTSVLDSQEDR